LLRDAPHSHREDDRTFLHQQPPTKQARLIQQHQAPSPIRKGHAARCRSNNAVTIHHPLWVQSRAQ